MGAGASIADAGTAAAVEKCRALLAPEKVKELWSRVDFNGNGYVSLAEIDKLVVEMQSDPASPFQGFNNKPALMRAYKASCLGGNNADWVERKEFPFLIRNLFFFDKLWDVFDDIDTDDDRRITQAEFTAACTRSALINNPSPAEVARIFDEMDTNDGNQILFDEFCAYTANKFINAAELDAAFEGTPAAGKPPRPLGKAKPAKGRSGTKEDAQPDIRTTKFDAAEAKVLGSLNDKAWLDETWRKIDFNGNGKVSLAEIDKMIVEQPDWQICNNKPALMRAYK
jgi:Ca2+-binding EF-hand superfamily protein